MAKSFRIAVIGCGAISGNHITAILQNGHTVCALCDILPEKAEALKEKYELADTPIFTDYKEMIEAVHPDSVHICTPHDLHAPMTVYALERNIHVLCEKPLCITMEQMKEVHRAANASKAQLGYCFQNRYEPNMIRLKELAKNGVLSALGTVVWKRDEKYYASAEWRGTIAHEGGGVMINQAIHTLDILQWICGMPTNVIAHVSNDCLGDAIEVEDTASARFETEDGNAFFIFATNTAKKDLPVELQVRLATGEMIVAQNHHLTVDHETVDSKKQETSVGKAEWGKGHTALTKDFYTCIEEGKPFPIGVEEADKAVRLIFAMYASNGKKIPIPQL